MKTILQPIQIEGATYVDGRELYDLFKIGRDFPTWIRAKIKQFNIKKDEYIEYSVPGPFGGRPQIHYNLSIAAAIKITSSMKTNRNSIEVLQFLSSLGSIEDMATQKTKKTKAKRKNKANKNTVIQMPKASDKPEEVFEDSMIVNNEIFGSIRFIIYKGKPHAVANDVLRALGYKEGSWRTTLSRKCKGVTKCNGLKVNGVSLNIIPEGDIYRLIVGSHLPEAIKFEEWIFDDVIPSIRQNGLYATTSTIDKMLNDPDAAIKLLENYKKEREEKEKLLVEMKKNEPKVMAYDDFISCDSLYSFAAATRILSIPRTATSNLHIGKNTLLAWLRRDGILMSEGIDRNIPYQRFFSQGFFELKAIEGEERRNNRATVMVTPKGVEWLYKKYRYSNMPKKITVAPANSFEGDQMELDIAL